jgi:type I restriction enzyme M protein
MARYVDTLKTDLKSVAASGWGAELIPDDEILQSEFPALIEELATKRARIDEVQALFAAADEEGYEDEDNIGVIASTEVKALKNLLKAHAAELKALVKAALGAAPDLVAELGLPKGAAKLGKLGDPDFVAVHRLAAAASEAGSTSHFAAPVRALADHGQAIVETLADAQGRLARHKALEDEAKALKADLRVAEKRRDDLVAAARAKITPEAARTQILLRFRHSLLATYRAYLEADRRAVTAAIENLHDKYAVTVRDIEKKRSDAAAELDGYLKALGYV